MQLWFDPWSKIRLLVMRAVQCIEESEKQAMAQPVQQRACDQYDHQLSSQIQRLLYMRF